VSDNDFTEQREIAMSEAKYPEHEKLQALNGANQTVGNFIEWLSEKQLVLAHYGDHDELFPTLQGRNDLIAEFFGIDQRKLEAEKQAMLASLGG
jgi:hypothetical protein